MDDACPLPNDEDLTAALREMKSYMDVTEDDLRKIYALALEHARARQQARRSVRELMATEVVTIGPEEDIQVAARLMSERRLGALPVVDETGRLIGMVCGADLVRGMVGR